MKGGVGHGVHRTRERLLVGPRGFVEAADLAHVLQGGGSDLLLGGGRIEVEEDSDVSTHARSVNGANAFLTLSARCPPRPNLVREAAVGSPTHRPERRGCMRHTIGVRSASAVLLASESIGVYAAVTSAVASAGAGHAVRAHSAKAGPSVKRFDLNGYVLDTDYSLGRNKGN